MSRDQATSASLDYLAGGLFNMRQLAGNLQLARVLELASEERTAVRLPQDLEVEAWGGAKAIRDADFGGLLDCQTAVFLFDGPELDSGTVAEFMAAKFLDRPPVLLRSDFRRAGDRNEEPWNLMCSFYPRTESVVVDALALYRRMRENAETGEQAALRALRNIAAPIWAWNASRVEQLKRLLGVEG